MSGIPVPALLTQRLARRAVEIAQIIGPRKTGAGLNSLLPVYQEGIIGIEIPDQYAYMYDLDQGIEEHAMVDLSGRVIPVRNPSGSISFRRAGQSQIGTIPIITRLSKDGRLNDGKPKWVYPRKDGLEFLQQSLKMSVEEWKKTAKTKDVIDLLMQSELKDDLTKIIYGRESL